MISALDCANIYTPTVDSQKRINETKPILSLFCVIEYFSFTTYVVIEGNAFELILIQSNLASTA